MKFPAPAAPATSEAPKTLWERIFSSTPIAMTMVATLLAGLSTSEMTRAQYDRSLAAQQQSKAGDQWSFFQAKKLRGALQQSMADTLALGSDAPVASVDALTRALRERAPTGDDPAFNAAVTALVSGKLPTAPVATFSPSLQAALTAVGSQKTEAEIDAPLLKVTDAELTVAVQGAKDAAVQLDDLFNPLIHQIELLDHSFASHSQTRAAARPAVGATNVPEAGTPPDGPLVSRKDFAASRVAFSVHRYDAEARLNQTLANLLELQVRKSNLSADRHYLRSQRFFFGMLFAQFSVIMSTFAIAVRMKNTLWTLAAVAGVFAVAFAGYVYLYV